MTTAVAAAAVLVVSAGPSALAAAERLITGTDVADHSIRGRPLASDAVGSTTIRKGAVTSATRGAEDPYPSVGGAGHGHVSMIEATATPADDSRRSSWDD